MIGCHDQSSERLGAAINKRILPHGCPSWRGLPVMACGLVVPTTCFRVRACVRAAGCHGACSMRRAGRPSGHTMRWGAACGANACACCLQTFLDLPGPSGAPAVLAEQLRVSDAAPVHACMRSRAHACAHKRMHACTHSYGWAVLRQGVGVLQMLRPRQAALPPPPHTHNVHAHGHDAGRVCAIAPFLALSIPRDMCVTRGMSGAGSRACTAACTTGCMRMLRASDHA